MKEADFGWKIRNFGVSPEQHRRGQGQGWEQSVGEGQHRPEPPKSQSPAQPGRARPRRPMGEAGAEGGGAWSERGRGLGETTPIFEGALAPPLPGVGGSQGEKSDLAQPRPRAAQSHTWEGKKNHQFQPKILPEIPEKSSKKFPQNFPRVLPQNPKNPQKIPRKTPQNPPQN